MDRRGLLQTTVRANARVRILVRVLGTLFGRRDDAQYREEARFREAGTTTCATAQSAAQHIITDTSTASQRCPRSSLLTLLFVNIVNENPDATPTDSIQEGLLEVRLCV